MTNEKLDQERANFAFAQSKAGDLFTDIAAHAARLAREGWTPPKPVDPDRLEAYNLAVFFGEEFGNYTPARLALKAIKRGRELERAEAKPGTVWVKHDGTGESPIAGHHLVAALFKGDQYIGLYNAIIAKWSDITHYAIITQPEEK